jgi:hypothetical protein
MKADDTNIDWDLTYADTSVAPRTQTDRYYRVGEIFSARALDQARSYGKATLTVFEGADQAPGRWSYRYGWISEGAHIGLIGSSDNHEQTPGAHDDWDLDGTNFHTNEPGGFAVVLAGTPGREGIYQALSQRQSYATSGVRAWFDFGIDGAPMGAEIARTAPVSAQVALLAGYDITAVELWGAKVARGAPYQKLQADAPNDETYAATISLANPVAAGAAPEEWIYYVRAFFRSSGSSYDADDALWSSPIWITWSH